jgi:uncharacterized protein (DUF1015 family)
LADIRPFHGVHYNPGVVKDLAKVICPPYDIIPPQMQQELYKRSEFNFIHIEFGRELPQDRPKDNRYTRAVATMENWLEQDVLQSDDKPAFYIADHRFRHQGKTYCRRSLNCLVKLEEWDKMIVRPHEGTLSKAKNDRLNLLRTLQANTSPVMVLYEDSGSRVSSLLSKVARGRPALSAHLNNGENHRVWTITDADVNAKIQDLLMGQPLYIADGHHRYESALAYRRERRAASPPANAEAPYDFVLMSLVDIDDPGLVILPAHRLVRGLSAPAVRGLPERLKTCFTVEELPLPKTNKMTQISHLLSEAPNEVKLILYGLKKDRLLLLTLRDFAIVRSMMPYFHSELYHRLDVSIVDHVILEELLGLTHDTAGVFIDYTNNALEAIDKVAGQEFQLALIVNPVRPGVIKAIADSGDRMPHKSTYFYPKIPAGLVFYRFG